MTSEVDKLGRRLAELEGRLNGFLRYGVGLGHSSFDSGAITKIDGDNPGAIFGGAYDGSQGAFPLNGPLPPIPAWGPDSGVFPVPGGFEIRWDGTFEDDGSGRPVVAPMNWSHLEVHASMDPSMSGMLFTTLKMTIQSARGGSVMFPASPGDWYFRLVARTATGQVSLASYRVGPYQPGTVGEDLLDPELVATITAASGKNSVTFSTDAPTDATPGTSPGDIWFQRDPDTTTLISAWEWNGAHWVVHVFGDGVMGSLTVSKLVTGVLQAGVKMTIGTPGGARIDIGGSAIEQFDAAGGITFQLIPGGGAFFSGTLTGRSQNYSEGSSGWILSEEGNATFQNLSALENISATSMSTTDLTVKGVPIETMLDYKPRGLRAQGFNNTLNIQGVTNEKGMVELSFLAEPGRGYVVTIDGPEYGASDTDTAVEFNLRYTNDGSAPTVNSTRFASTNSLYPAGPNSLGNFPGRWLRQSFLWYPPTVGGVTTRIRMLLTFRRSWGNGTVGINATSPTGIGHVQMWVEDAGPTLPNSMVVNGSQATSPPPPPAAAPVAHEETFFSTWTASYRQNGSRWSEGDKLYQGYGDSFNGIQGSMIGFNLADIRSKIAGGTLRWAKLYCLNMHAWWNSGMTAWVGTHGNDNMPATWGGPAFIERRASVQVSEGGWFELDVTGAFQEIVNSASSGFLLGRPPNSDSHYYGYFAGQNYDGRPRIVAHWEK